MTKFRSNTFRFKNFWSYITAATTLLTDEEFDRFIRVCYDRKKYPRTYDVYTEWPSNIFKIDTWNRIIKSYGDTFTDKEVEMIESDGWSPYLCKIAQEQRKKGLCGIDKRVIRNGCLYDK